MAGSLITQSHVRVLQHADLEVSGAAAVSGYIEVQYHGRFVSAALDVLGSATNETEYLAMGGIPWWGAGRAILLQGGASMQVSGALNVTQGSIYLDFGGSCAQPVTRTRARARTR